MEPSPRAPLPVPSPDRLRGDGVVRPGGARAGAAVGGGRRSTRKTSQKNPTIKELDSAKLLL